MATTVFGTVYGLNGGSATVNFGGGNTVTTDAGGAFEISLPNGTYTASATASNGSTVFPSSLQVVVNNQSSLTILTGFWVAPIVQAVLAIVEAPGPGSIPLPNPVTAGNRLIVFAIASSSSSTDNYETTVAAVTASDSQSLSYSHIGSGLGISGSIGGAIIKQTVHCCLSAGSAQAGSDTITIGLATNILTALVYVFEVPPSIVPSSLGGSTYDPSGSVFSITANFNIAPPSQGLYFAGVSNSDVHGNQFAASSGWQVIDDGLGGKGVTITSEQLNSVTFSLFDSASAMDVPILASIWAFTLLSISGNAGVAGATVSYSGASSGSVVADGSGNYAIFGLAAGNYTITPSRTGWTFSPPSSSQTITPSNTTVVNFTATQIQVATPTISPVSGTYSGPVTVTISCATPGANIFYTLDGDFIDSELYTGPFVINPPLTVEAVGSLAFFEQSDLASATYTAPPGKPSPVPLPFSKRTTTAVALFRCIGTASPQGAQQYASTVQVGQLSAVYSSMLATYKQLVRQDRRAQAVKLDALIATALSQVTALNAIVQAIVPGPASGVASTVAQMQEITAQAVVQITNASLAPDDGE